MNDQKFQTTIIVGMAVAALVGAVSGAFVLNTLNGSIFFGRPTSSPLNPAQVDKKIVELIEEESASIAVVERVTPSVVSIVVKEERGKLTSEGSRFPFSPFLVPLQPLTEEQSKELVEVSSGTGFFVSEDGLVITNRHVVDSKGTSFVVVTNEGKEYPATLIDIDPFQDVAVLRVEGSGFPVTILGNSDTIQIGQTVIAIGNTLSEFRNTVTKGVVSGINRRVSAGTAVNTEVIEQAIQTDAAINPGNSGGPLINLRGEVIGINTAVSVSGQSVGFAIPINQAKRAVEDVRAFGRIVRPWLGVRYALVEQKMNQENTIPYELGAMIVAGLQPGQSGIVSGSPAEKAGLKEADVIIRINGINLSKQKTLSDLISGFHPGDTIDLEFIRDGVLKKIPLTLAEYDQEKL